MQRPAALALTTLLTVGALPAQDTLRISLAQADSLLLARSLSLVVQQGQVDMAEADRVQAKLFTNPAVATEWSVRPGTGHLFDVAAPDGQMAVQVSKLFRIAGQRALAVRAAAGRVRLAEAEYAELAAALRYDLHSKLHRQYYTVRALIAITSQLDLLKGVIDRYDGQLERGNVSLKDVARLRTAYFHLNDRRVGLRMDLNAIQQDLRTLLMEDRTVMASPMAEELRPLRPLALDSLQLVVMAEADGPRVRTARAELEVSEAESRLQRRMAWPDLELGWTWDRNSNYLPNYNGLDAGIALPLFDRNQGGIRRAQAAERAARDRAELARQGVRQEVLRALADLRALQQQYTGTTMGLDEQLDQLSESLIGNYEKSNLSLLEFTDLFEAYTGGIIAINALKADLLQAYEQLEYVVGRRLYAR